MSAIDGATLFTDTFSGNVDVAKFIATFFKEPFVAVPFLTREDLGLAGDGVTDDSFVLNNKLRELYNAGRSAVIWLDPQDGKFFYFNASVDLRTNQWLIFSSRNTGANVVFGAKGRFRIYGSLAEDPPSNLPKLRATCPAGTTTIFLALTPESAASAFSVGQRIIIRGQSDANGVSLQKEENTVTAVDTINNNLTVLLPLEDTYEPVYPPGDYEAKTGQPDRSFVTRLVSFNLSADAAQGATSINLTSATGIAVGDYVYITDNSVAADVAGSSFNYTKQEVAQIVSIASLTVTLSHSLYHSYTTAKNARMIKLECIQNARITGARVSWNAPSYSTNQHAFTMAYAANCLIDDCHVSDVAGFGSTGNGFRLDIGYNNRVTQCSVERPYLINAANGYGFAFYGATNCAVSQAYTYGCRHAYLLFKGAAGNQLTDITAVNTTVSDIDMHGANEIYNHVQGFILIGGPTISGGSSSKAGIRIGNPTHLAGGSYNTFANGKMSLPDTGNTTYGIDIIPRSIGNVFRDIEIRGYSVGLRIVDATGDGTIKVEETIADSLEIINPTDRAMLLRSNANGSSTRIIKNLDVINCKVYGATRHVDLVQAENVNIIGLKVLRPGSTVTYNFGIDAENVLSLRITGCHIADTQRAIRLKDNPSCRVVDNTFCDLISASSAINDVSGNTGASLTPNTDVP
jgi:hypothetical protein